MRMRVRPERSSGRVEALAPADLVFPHFFDERCALQAKHTGCIGNDIAAGGERGADQRLPKRCDHLSHVALVGDAHRARIEVLSSTQDIRRAPTREKGWKYY